MSVGGEREIDVLDALSEAIEELIAAIDAAGVSSTYIEGQRAFFEAAWDAIGEAGETERPQTVMERVASEAGLEVVDGELTEAPLDEHRAGALAAWGICIGYVEGFPDGARTVIDEVDQLAGVTGSMGETEGEPP